MSLSQWLLALHVTGAFLFLGGGVLAAAFNVAAQRSERPSEIALFFGLTRVAVVVIAFGALLDARARLLARAATRTSRSATLWVVPRSSSGSSRRAWAGRRHARPSRRAQLAERARRRRATRERRAARRHARPAHARAVVRKRRSSSSSSSR